MGAFLANIRALDGQNSSFAHPLLRSATTLRVQSVIELPKEFANALNVHLIVMFKPFWVSRQRL